MGNSDREARLAAAKQSLKDLQAARQALEELAAELTEMERIIMLRRATPKGGTE